VAEHKVRLYKWRTVSKGDFTEGVVQTEAPNPPQFLFLEGGIYARRDALYEGDYTVYCLYMQVPEVQVTSRG